MTTTKEELLRKFASIDEDTAVSSRGFTSVDALIGKRHTPRHVPPNTVGIGKNDKTRTQLVFSIEAGLLKATGMRQGDSVDVRFSGRDVLIIPGGRRTLRARSAGAGRRAGPKSKTTLLSIPGLFLCSETTRVPATVYGDGILFTLPDSLVRNPDFIIRRQD